MNASAAVDWASIDTVLLDMDGTLLDLRFDNWFWAELIPSHFAAARGISPQQAREFLEPRFRSVRGTIEWYCIEHWSRELELDVAQIKRGALGHIRYLPGAEEFLLKLRALRKRVVLVTNAHPVTLAIKSERVQLAQHFDACYSTHTFATPKENPGFWPQLLQIEPFAPQRALFVDDSLPVLDSARGFGIECLRAIRRPDSSRPAQPTGSYTAIDRVADLL